MDQEVTPAESGTPDGAGNAPPSRVEGSHARRTVPAALILAVAAVLLGLQAAGVILRDRVEGRVPILSEAPAETGEGAAPGRGSSTVASRFGPEVREVPIASPLEPPPPPAAVEPPASPVAAEPPTAEPLAPSPAPAAPAEPSPPPAAVAAEAPPSPAPAERPAPPQAPAAPAPAPPAPAKTTPATPPSAAAAEGTHALQVGVFRSQRYRHEMEETLTGLGVPFFRVETWRDGTGYRLAVPTPDEATRRRAREVLEGGGYAFREGKNVVEAFFHLETEAQTALGLLSRVGLNGGYGKVEGPMPLWTLYAGPFSRDAARRTQDELDQKGIPAILKKRP